MDLAYIKIVLKALGVRDLSVVFDDPNRQIIAKFTKGGQEHTELVSFADIEKALTEGPIQAHSSSLMAVPSKTGTG